ncbi:hypothetical protein FSP39_019194 [Pinctada imbricata]|uniref:Uncharacterized protein n=1 Tax=Pinctada imbricata TaxID=66713 RepID=A0AA88YPZ8_PINIB|nr:hypothetical protein FSP39_019194 [Pinctada imbricata]
MIKKWGFFLLFRCDCGNCETMATNEECLCCHEVGPIEEILDQSSITCFTQHEGFIGNCLNRYVIQVSLLAPCPNAFCT